MSSVQSSRPGIREFAPGMETDYAVGSRPALPKTVHGGLRNRVMIDCFPYQSRFEACALAIYPLTANTRSPFHSEPAHGTTRIMDGQE
jgi:hypothetical protein